MPSQPVSGLLKGGDRRSIGRSDQVAKLVLRAPGRFGKLIECLWNDDPIVRMRAADAAEKVSAVQPGLLKPYKTELLSLLAEAEEIELRWHLAPTIPRLPLTQGERRRAQMHCKFIWKIEAPLFALLLFRRWRTSHEMTESCGLR